MGIRDRKTIRDPRGMQTAQFISGMSNIFAKGQQQRSARKEKEEKELQGLRRQASSATKGYAEKRAAYKKTGIKSLDTQIYEELEKKAREASNLYMDAYGPSGTPEAMLTYQQTVAQDMKELDDLTVFVGTLDADLERRDEGIEKDNLMTGTDEDGNPILVSETEKFKNGILNGDSELTLVSGPNGYEITDVTGKMKKPINLSEYHETIKTEGSAYGLLNEDLEEQINLYSGNILDKDLMGRIKKGYKAPEMLDTELAAANKAIDEDIKKLDTASGTYKADLAKLEEDKKKNEKLSRTTKTSKQINREEATAEVLKKLNQDSGTELKGYKKDGVIPNERELWAFLQDNNYITNIPDYDDPNFGIITVNEDVAWDSYGASKKEKMKVLNEAYANYLVDSQVFGGASGDVAEFDVSYAESQDIDTSKYKN